MDIVVAGTQRELERCLAVRHAVFTVERKVPREIEVDEQDCLGSACEHFLILESGAEVGALRCMRADLNKVKIQRFCILADYRGMGYARRALAFVEEYYRSAGKTEIELDSKLEACGFYDKCGYTRVSDPFEEAGIPHIKMIKCLRL